MKKIRRMFRRKIRSQAGETFTEVLASMVIISLAALLLASMLMASQRVIKRSAEGYKRFIEQVNALETRGASISDPNSKYSADQLGYQKVSDGTSVTVAGTITGNSNINFSETVSPITAYQIKENGSVVMQSYAK